MTYSIPSHQNSTNERNERRQNWKTVMSRHAEAKKPELSAEAATAKFEKLATAFVASGAVSQTSGNCYQVRVGAGAKFYPVYRIQGAFRCECRDSERYSDCGHARAAAIFAAETEIVEPEKQYTAALHYVNRDGLDFEKQGKFANRRAACEWLALESFNKFQPTGEVTDCFGGVVFEITDEFFDLWANV